MEFTGGFDGMLDAIVGKRTMIIEQVRVIND
jgi:hypothetical protein